MSIELRHVSKAFPGNIRAVERVDLTLERGESLALVGLSGSGKSTLLRLIAGLETPTSGDVLFDGVAGQSLRPHQRHVALVPQEGALLEHLDVAAHVELPLRLMKVVAGERRTRAREMLDSLDLSHLAKRFAHQLSGGERQRVALARALVAKPRTLLLDEPLAYVDAPARRELRSWLRQLADRRETTMVHVTHDIEEAAAIAGRMAVMVEGRIVQAGSWDELRHNPLTATVAALVMA